MLSRFSVRSVLCLVVSVGVVWACSGNEPAKDDSDPPSTTYDAASYCGTLQARLRECGVLGAGRYHCENFTDAAEECETSCLREAECSGIVSFQCGYSGAVPRCFEGCIGLSPFTCDDGLVLSAYLRCSGAEDCAGGEDELDCPTVLTYKCRNVDERIDRALVCDGQPDCSDGSDETPGCGTALTCDDVPVSGYQVCDGFATCEDGSDEPAGCATASCG